MNLKEIEKACAPARILAVSKLQSVAKIRALYDEGQRQFGENYVQEALEKITALEELTEIEWHFIGHLQKNKTKFVAGKFKLIHSVDSLALSLHLSKHCQALQVIQNILIQVNLAGEESKGGFGKEELLTHWPELTQMPNLKICGLMTMPPLTETGENVRHYFQELRQLRETLKLTTDLNRHPLTELSMGTSHDYKVAAEEGATIVRLGTILFGERTRKM